MPHIELTLPTPEHEASVMEYRDECIANQSTIHGSGDLDTFGTYDAWLDKAKRDHDAPDQGRVAATQYIALNDAGRLVGMIQLRHDLNEYLLNFGGHIGYSVRPSERRKGYASQMLARCLDEARALGISRVLITCDTDNIGSRRVIEKAGGVLENTVDSPTTGKQTLRFWVGLSPNDRLSIRQESR